MPNKTIYVADADLAIFEQAQALAGENLSATIAQALRRFVEVEEARTRGFDLVTLKVGSKGMYTKKQFLGRELARQRVRDERQPRITTSVVFQTAKGRFVLYVRSAPDWTAWASSWGSDWDNDWDVDVDVDVDPGARPRDWWEAKPPSVHPRDWWQARRRARQQARGHDRTHFDWPAWTSGSEYTMEVYETLEELKPHIADDLYASAEHALHGEETEFLDI